MNLLILDSGHAFDTKGKNNAKENFYEWEFNNDMQYKIKARCEELGIKVFLTNPNPNKVSDINLTTRASLANDYWLRNSKPKSMFVSIHANAYSSASARGTETYTANNASSASKNFAKVLNNEIVKTMKELDPASKDRGVKTENFTVIYKASMPSVLVEYGFYSNLDDLKILKNNRSELVEATVKAICNYFNIEYKEKVKVNENKFNGLYAVCVGAYKDRNKANAIVEELKKKGYTSTYLIIR
jgi:N-acetylmuramoyl-L-alanine amidase